MDDGAVSLARHGPLGRFDAAVEAEYRAWFVQRFRSLGAALAMASAVCWVFNAPLAQPSIRPDRVALVYIVCWGVNVPTLILGAVYLRRPRPRWAVSVATALLVLAAV